MAYDRANLVHRVISDSPAVHLRYHGPKHWLTVAQKGMKLAEAEGADPVFCELFGLLHDCQRLTDDRDPGHGARAAEYARSIGTIIPLGVRQFKKLLYALTWHDDKERAPDVQTGCCWDADRLDLPRVGAIVDPGFLNTKTAKQLVQPRRRS